MSGSVWGRLSDGAFYHDYEGGNRVKWVKKNYRTILLWLVLIAVAPVFAEILFIANIVGVEVAFTFLLLLLKDIKLNILVWIDEIKRSTSASLKILQSHAIFQLRTYLVHASASILILLFSGALAYSVMVWYPMVLFGSTPT